MTDQTANNRATILIVDDGPDIVGLMPMVFEGAGHTVLTALDGESALAAGQQYGPSVRLLIADVVLPGMSGPQLAERLYADHPALSVIFTTGYPLEQVAADIAPVPHAMLLMKPVRIKALARAVSKLLR